jgi:hypothetical protein
VHTLRISLYREVPINAQLLDNTSRLLLAIDHCAAQGYRTASLILLYSTIDIMAWLDRPRQHEDTIREDFQRWVETFLLPGSDLNCTPEDLYAARCAVVHSGAARSRLSREGKAREILYAWGEAHVDDLQDALGCAKLPAVAVHIGTLTEALRRGVSRFASALSNDASTAQLVRERVRLFFQDIPLESLDGP